MEKERNLYKIVVDSKTLRYPIFAERIFHEPADDKHGYDSSVFKELLTGIRLYRGYIHPLLSRSVNAQPYLYPYAHPDKVLEEAKTWLKEEDGLYFDEYSEISEVTEVSPKEVRDYYMSFYSDTRMRHNLSEYIKMFDEALSAQQKEVEQSFKENFEFERMAYLYTMLHEDEKLDDKELINKLVTR